MEPGEMRIDRWLTIGFLIAVAGELAIFVAAMIWTISDVMRGGM